MIKMASLIISGPYFWSGIARPGPTLPPPMLRWADVEYPYIYNYFIATPGVTKQQLKAYKSMDGYKFFQDGWVSDVVVWSIPAVKSACLVSGKVKHSVLSVHSQCLHSQCKHSQCK